MKYLFFYKKIIIVTLLFMGINSATASTCEQYAQTAVQQYYLANNLNMPGIVAPAWNGNYNDHKTWCNIVIKQHNGFNIIQQETQKRQEHINKSSKEII